jgi:hypothetical protein
VKTLQGVKGPMAVIAVLCLVVLIGPTARAQLQPNDFDVPDGRIEKAAGDRLMVSTKEVCAPPSSFRLNRMSP